MPNWCQNNLTITGPEADVRSLKAKAIGRSPWEEPEGEPNALNFHSLVPVPEEVLKAGYDSAGHDWEQKNWGCKWGPSGPGILDEWEGHVEYEFYTAWAPPIEFLKRVALQWPALIFVLTYEEPGVAFKGLANSTARSTKTTAFPSNQNPTNHEPDAYNRVRLFSLNNMKTESESETQTEYPFTVDQYKALAPDRRQAIEAVAEYLTGSGVPTGENLTDEEITWTFNLLKPCEGPVPPEEVDGDLLTVIRKKFRAVYEVGLEMAEEELKKQGYIDFSFCMVVDPSYEDATHVAIVDYHKPICHLHEWIKPWHLSFDSLNALADAVLAVQNRLVEKVTKPIEIFVVMDGGLIHEIMDLPESTKITVLDYDTEGVEKERLEISPFDGELCTINAW